MKPLRLRSLLELAIFLLLVPLPSTKRLAAAFIPNSSLLLQHSSISRDTRLKMSVSELTVSIKIVEVDKPDEVNVVVGMTHFIKSVDDIHEAMVNAVPDIKFGLGFCEASGDRLVRWTGTDERLIEIAKRNALAMACGHSFILVLGPPVFPIHVLKSLKDVPEVCRILCATQNRLQLVVAETEAGRGIMGVIDGETPLGVEGEDEIKKRRNFLKMIGYKL
ncbi:adenosine specific kinase-domain containing protein [Nitzschia inconspicua]|uniref:Adenosine specific kinase-domain containing protein n=1 Tax=Nitzschia inconspicua TaxID=303405 RepID=A0A9K3M2D6_9STRA|nr:adenosine specific kinase-domain containing protein [Nitzschia inconspicua]